ncbi:MAG: hypothetical protein ACLR2E_07900 [Lachnospiraceae bacterium]
MLGLGLSLLAGTVFYKAVLLLLCRILHAPRILGFEFSVSAFTETVVLFGMVFFCWPSMACARSSALRPRSF